MLATLKKIFSPPAHQTQAYMAYAAIVAQARQPLFFRDLEVPDTIDGRFDVIALHMFLVMERLQKDDPHPSPLSRRQRENTDEFTRALQETFFADMDRGLREMGVGDTGISKRVKAMAQAFYGRMQAYGQTRNDNEKFKASLKRNIYRDENISDAALDSLFAYARRAAETLHQQSSASIISGKIAF